uniref:Uncharacterized protein n=1 Tax=Arundo donax TaxID=35708 RepID=A0A0A9GB01_ARUDO
MELPFMLVSWCPLFPRCRLSKLFISLALHLFEHTLASLLPNLSLDA